MTDGQYLQTRQAVPDKGTSTPQVDAVGNHRVMFEGYLGALGDSVTAWEKGATVVNLTASGQLLASAGQILGYHINSTTIGGTFRFSDALAATTPYLGAAIGTSTTNNGTFQRFPAKLNTGGYCTITGTMDISVFVLADPTN